MPRSTGSTFPAGSTAATLAGGPSEKRAPPAASQFEAGPASLKIRRSATPLPCRSADAAGDCVGVFPHLVGARDLIENPHPAASDAALRMPVLHRRLRLRRRQK